MNIKLKVKTYNFLDLPDTSQRLRDCVSLLIKKTLAIQEAKLNLRPTHISEILPETIKQIKQGQNKLMKNE